MKEFNTDKVPVPDGHSVARAILGFDEDGDLLIVQCDEHWAPYEYNEEDNLFVGTVQRLVYYRKTEEQPPETVTYFQVNSNNTISVCTPEGKVPPQYNDCKIEAENLSPFDFEYFVKKGVEGFIMKEAPITTFETPKPAHITTENVCGYEATVVRDPFDEPMAIVKHVVHRDSEEYIGTTKVMNYPEFIETIQKKRDAMIGVELTAAADKAFEDHAKKRKDAFLSNALSQPRKGPFDK